MRRALEALLRSTLRPPVTQLAAPRPVPPTRNPEEPFTFFRSSIQQSDLKDSNIVLAQKIGMLEWEVRKQAAEIERLNREVFEKQ